MATPFENKLLTEFPI